MSPVEPMAATRPAPARAALLAWMLLAALPAFPDYPQLKALTRDDPLYVQLEAALAEDYRAMQDRLTPPAERPAPPPLSIFSYRPRASEDLFGIAARLSIPYDALASLNGAESVASFNALRRILVPSRPGLFVSDPPRGGLEDLMLTTRRADGLAPERLVIERDGKGEPMWFFAGESFSPVERAYFLQVLHLFPIDGAGTTSPVRGTITSAYGARSNPFSGHPEFHNGVDIAAPTGTQVRAARDGTVAGAGTDPILGTYVILSHGDGWQTVYGHLATRSVTLGERVSEGAAIGRVGASGRATGPHLHFEVRHEGDSVDPGSLLAMEKR